MHEKAQGSLRGPPTTTHQGEKLLLSSFPWLFRVCCVSFRVIFLPVPAPSRQGQPMGGTTEYFIAPLGCPALPPLRAGVALQGGSGFPAAVPGLVPCSDQSFAASLVRLFGGRWCRVWCVLCPLCPCRRCGLSLVAAVSGGPRGPVRGRGGGVGCRRRFVLLCGRGSARCLGGSSPPARGLAAPPSRGVRRLWPGWRWLVVRRVRRGRRAPCCPAWCVRALGLRPGPACPVSRPPVPPCPRSGWLCRRWCARLVSRGRPRLAVLAWLVALLRPGCARRCARRRPLRLLWPAAARLVRLWPLVARALPAVARWRVRVALVPRRPRSAGVALVGGVARGCVVLVARLLGAGAFRPPLRLMRSPDGARRGLVR